MCSYRMTLVAFIGAVALATARGQQNDGRDGPGSERPNTPRSEDALGNDAVKPAVHVELGNHPNPRQQASGFRWLAVADSEPSARAQATVVRASDAGQEVAFTTPGVFSSTALAADGSEYARLSVPGCGATAAEVGLPEMPFKGFFLEIPYGVEVSVGVTDQTVVPLGTGYRVYPLQPPRPDSGPQPPFEIDATAYATDAFFPPEPVVIDEPGFIRGRRVVFVQVFPLRYNPVTTELQALAGLRFNLAFAGTVNRAGESRKRRLANAESEAVAEGLILNYRPVTLPRGAGRQGRFGEEGADYLVIVKDQSPNLQEEIQPLVDWKKAKGFRTKVVGMSTVGTTATDVENYIDNAYDTWPRVPYYVLLVGDHQDIPAKQVSPGGYTCYTDIDYACVHGDDYYPDLAIGRLPVRTESDCTNVVNKILAYDRNPQLYAAWYTRFLSAAYFEDDDNNAYADRHFMETSVQVRDFLANHSMVTYTAWCTTHWPLTYGLGQYHYASTPLYTRRFPIPDPLPESIPGAWVSGTQATADVTATINNGVGHVLHRDHGGETSWVDPNYTLADISSLTNGSMTPVVFSFNCLTGKFNRSGGDCWCEHFLKTSPGGCVGAVGATRVSFSGYNDLIVHGMYDCFWCDYDPNYAAAMVSSKMDYRSRRPAVALNDGKYYMMICHGTGNVTEAEFYMFHWFGDPEMQLRTEMPLPVAVDVQFRGTPLNGDTYVMVLGDRQEPLAGARVTISHPSADDYWTGLTDASGSITFYDMEFTEPSGYTLVVTAVGRAPYEESLDIDGACCDDDTGDCQDYVPMLGCSGRWSTGLCADLDPPCHMGACCYDDGNCALMPEDACGGPNAAWLGYGVSCDECCVLICPPEVNSEGEPCGWDTNGGCDMAEPAFEPIGCGEIMCGTLWATALMHDSDWYELASTSEQAFTITLEAECPTIIGIMQQIEWGEPGCDNVTGEFVWFDATTPCLEASVTSPCLPPGTYYLRVAADAEEGYPCDPDGRGNDYVLTVTCDTCEEVVGACCDDVAGVCDEGVYGFNCQGHGLRFLADGACDDFEPPCGSLGACCNDQNGTCEGNVPEAYCQGDGLRFLAAPATCDDFDPACGTLWGICCGPEPGQCVIDVFESECQAPGEYFLAAPASCDDCETAASGACCSDSTGTCEEDTYEFNCRRPWMRFLQDGTCDEFEPPCGPAWGACCDDNLGICEEGIYESQCQDAGMRFLAGGTCADLDPPCGVLAGACCFSDGHCEVLPEAGCAAAAGDYQGNFTPCVPNPCCTGQTMGDTNCDGLINGFDIDCFVWALTGGEAGWLAAGCDGGGACKFYCVADVNGDGLVNAFDIDPFVALLVGG